MPASKIELLNGKYIDDQMANGVPEGGTTGQVLAKATNDDYDTEWVTGGGGGSQNLQQVTDIGNTTTNNIVIESGTFTTSYEINRIYGYNSSDGENFIINFPPTDDHTINFPADNGTLVLSVNGQPADQYGAITIPVGTGTVTDVTATLPLSSTGGVTPDISITQSDASTDGYLSSTDWNTFNGKFNLPSFTAGSVLFSNGTTLAEDNANFFWDDGNNRLGIGTSSPAYKLDISTNAKITNANPTGANLYLGTSSTNILSLRTYGISTNNLAVVGLNIVESGNRYDTLIQGGGLFLDDRTGIDPVRLMYVPGGSSATVLGVAVGSTGNVGIGQALPSYKLDVDGTFHTTGENTLSNLATGGADQMVTADTNGKLKIQTIPIGTGTVTSVATAGLISGGTITNTGTISTSMTTGKLVGRYSSGTGIMEEISVGSGLTLTGAGILNNTATPTPLGYYGAWQDLVTQTAAADNVGYTMIFRTQDIVPNGISIVNNGSSLPTQITFANSGIYNIQFSSEFQSNSTAIETITIWLRKNGVDVVGSAGVLTTAVKKAGNVYTAIASWNYLLDIVGGEYYELVWSTTNHTDVTMKYYPAGSPPPAAASVILSVTQQSGIMAGTGISRGIYSVSTNTTAGNGANVDYVYLVSGTTTITLPTAVGNTNTYTIKRVDGGTVSIATTSSQTIDGSASPITINVQYVSLTVVSDGSNWNII